MSWIAVGGTAVSAVGGLLGGGGGGAPPTPAPPITTTTTFGDVNFTPRSGSSPSWVPWLVAVGVGILSVFGFFLFSRRKK